MESLHKFRVGKNEVGEPERYPLYINMSGLDNIIILPTHMHIVVYMYIVRRMKSKLLLKVLSHT